MSASSAAEVPASSAEVQLVDTSDPKTVSDFKNFLQDLDPDSYAKRWGNLPPSRIEKSIRDYNYLFAYKDGKVVGAADYAPNTGYDDSTVANVNVIVNAAYHGTGTGKALIEAREENMRRDGYRHKVGGVYRHNEAQVQRLFGHLMH